MDIYETISSPKINIVGLWSDQSSRIDVAMQVGFFSFF